MTTTISPIKGWPQFLFDAGLVAEDDEELMNIIFLKKMVNFDPVDSEIDYNPHPHHFSKPNRQRKQYCNRPYHFGRKRCHLVMVSSRMS